MNAVSPFCLAILLCSVGVFANMKDFRETKCFETMGITEEDWKKHEDEPNPEIDEKIGCLHACIMKRTNTMSDDNVIDVAAVEKLLEDMDDLPDGAMSYAKENMPRCAEEAQKLEGECEIAKHFVACTFAPELQSSPAEK